MHSNVLRMSNLEDIERLINECFFATVLNIPEYDFFLIKDLAKNVRGNPNELASVINKLETHQPLPIRNTFKCRMFLKFCLLNNNDLCELVQLYQSYTI